MMWYCHISASDISVEAWEKGLYVPEREEIATW